MSVRITCHGRSHFLQRPIHHAHLFRIVIPDIASEVIGDMLSGLSTVEELVGESIQKSQRIVWTFPLYPTREDRSGFIRVALDFARSF